MVRILHIVILMHKMHAVHMHPILIQVNESIRQLQCHRCVNEVFDVYLLKSISLFRNSLTLRALFIHSLSKLACTGEKIP